MHKFLFAQHPDTDFRRHSNPGLASRPAPQTMPINSTVRRASEPTLQRFLQRQPRQPPPFFDPSDPVLTLQQQGFQLLPPQQASSASPLLQVRSLLHFHCAVLAKRLASHAFCQLQS